MRTLIFWGLLIGLSNCLFAQSNIGIGTATPHASAQLDITAIDKGVLVPRVALTNVFLAGPVAGPATGLLVWNTNAVVGNGNGEGFYYWAGSRWQKISSATEGWSLTGNGNVDTAIHFLGTTNNAGLMLRIGNQKAGGIFNSGNTFLGIHAGRFVKFNSNDFTGEDNTFIGSTAGQNQVTGRANTFIGARAGVNSQGGFGNTFVGYQVGGGNTGDQNTALGVGAGGSTTGSRNIAIGSSAGSTLQNGYENVMIGYDVGSFLFDDNNAPAYGNVWIGSRAATGNFGIFPKLQSINNVIIGDSAARQVNGAIANVFVGKRSGMSSISGRFNVFVGDSSGINNTTGQRNTYIGSKARGSTGTRLNATAIGANAEAGADNVLVLGSIASINGATNSVNVGIGTTTPNRRLYIQDGTSSGVNSSSNSLLVLDKTGGPNYISILNGATFESGLIFARAGSPQPPFDGGIFYNVTNTPGGMQFRNAGGLTRMIIHDNGNISMGVVNNSHRLYVAQPNTLSGVTANGNSLLVLDRATTGANYLSMLTTTGEQGLMFGTSNSNTDGGILFNHPNVLRGLSFRTSGTSHRMVVGSNGNIGMGTTAPEYRLHVVTNDAQNFGYRECIMIENIAQDAGGTINTGEAAISFKNAGASGTGINQWMLGLNQNRNFAFAYGADFAGGSITKMLLDSTGNLGIGTTSPSQKLHVIGNILASGTITPSDVRFKKNILPMSSLLPQVLALQPMYYEWKKDEFPQYAFNDERSFGVMAQQLEANFPELVVTGNDGYKAVDYSRLSVVLLKALQEQQAIMEKQDEKIELLNKRLQDLEMRNTK
ncbi:MAG TPA: tail fiber domain-containing protein [Phnomibacter sp.]|nr:tail fiber domain-containing protein [Phnomibacter sp.]